MAKGTKAGKTPSKTKSARVTRGRASSKRFIDDEAAGSDDGVMVEAHGPGEDEYDIVANESDVAFIDDRDLDGTLSANSSTNESRIEHPKKRAAIKSAKKKTLARSSDAVIDIGDSSSEEDLTAMDVDDSMFKKPAGVKSSALPSPLSTRSAANTRLQSTVNKPSISENKKSASGDASSADSDPSFQMNADQIRQFTAWMKSKNEDPAIGASSDDAPILDDKPNKRVDFDEIESKKATKASSRPVAKQLRELSPDWDPPMSIGDPLDDPKGKKRTFSSRKMASTDSDEDVDVEARREKKTAMSSRPIGKHIAEDEPRAAASSGQDEGVQEASEDGNGSDSEPPSTVFLEDLETYKAYFDPRAPCGVNDPDLHDPLLAPGYKDLHPLPGGRQILPAFDPQGMATSETGDFKGGRVKFSSWRRHLKHMLADNSIGALVFKEAEPNFINPSRVSPLKLSRQASPGSSPTQRLLVGSRIAVCVSAVFCSESVVVEAAKIGPKSERLRKWVSGVFHNQEWERFEALMCLVFGEETMYSQITPKKAIAFQTMISPDGAGGSRDVEQRFGTAAPADMFSPVLSKSPSKKPGTPKPVFKSKTLLAYNDAIPVYDARKVVVDFQADLDRLDQVLPRFSGEIPFSSFIVVGYTASSYQGTLSGSNERVAQLGCNVLWVIVCGTPVLKKRMDA